MNLIYIALGLIQLVSFGFLLISYWTAPVGYEDESGFHSRNEPLI